jgi:hypothetical protein
MEPPIACSLYSPCRHHIFRQACTGLHHTADAPIQRTICCSTVHAVHLMRVAAAEEQLAQAGNVLHADCAVSRTLLSSATPAAGNEESIQACDRHIMMKSCSASTKQHHLQFTVHTAVVLVCTSEVGASTQQQAPACWVCCAAHNMCRRITFIRTEIPCMNNRYVACRKRCQRGVRSSLMPDSNDTCQPPPGGKTCSHKGGGDAHNRGNWGASSI